jgi:hypothetical protein
MPAYLQESPSPAKPSNGVCYTGYSSSGNMSGSMSGGMAGREMRRSPVPNEKPYNRNSHGRSSSQNNGPPPPAYPSPSRQYDSRVASGQPSRAPMQAPMQAPIPTAGYGGHMGHSPANYYPPHQPSYAPGPYYNVPSHQRYPQSYVPPPGGYMGGAPPMGRPMAPGMYAPSGMPVGYGQPPMPVNQLNQYEEQLFNEAYALLNEIKTSNLSEMALTDKKQRINQILSNHPKVHQKLKDSLPPRS